MEGTDTILESTKKMLGISDQDTHFDPDIIMHINSVLMVLRQIGVGPKEGFMIADGFEKWEDFIPDSMDFIAIKTYVYLKVKMLFDPPLSSAVMECMKRNIDELEWRLNNEAEDPRPQPEEVY